MRKVLFVIGSLQVGGAETVLVDILNNIYKEYDITLLLIEKRGELLEQLDSHIKLKYLTLGDSFCPNPISKWYNHIKRSLLYRKLGKNNAYVKHIYRHYLKDTYDVEVAFLAGLPSDIVERSPNNKSKKIAWIHADVVKSDAKTYNKYLNIDKSFDTIIGVSEASIKTYEETFPSSKGRLILIHNYIDLKKIEDKAKEKVLLPFSEDKYNFFLLGRLVDDKGFDRIIKLARDYEDRINFYIGGEGPLKEELEESIRSKNINNVKLLGLLPNPYPYFSHATAFILSSRSEAYPTALLEAVILNKSIIATEVSGTLEILEGYRDRIIVPNTDRGLKVGIDSWLDAHTKNKKEKVQNNFVKINEENLTKVKNILNS